MKKKNAMFVHAGNLTVDKNGVPNEGRCQAILDELRGYVLESGIIEDLEFIELGLVGDPNVGFDLPKAQMVYHGPDVHQWEFPTLFRIMHYCKANPDANVLYVHTKGSSNHVGVPEFRWIEDVRNYQLYFNVAGYRDSLQLLEQYDAVGVELLDDPVKHFSQNFWWARASHINTLAAPHKLPVVFDFRHNCEFWVCSNPDGRYKSKFNIYNHYVDAYDFSKQLYR